MDNYIIKEIAIERIKRVKPHVVMSEYGVGYERGLKDAIGILNATPAVGVQPMKRGRWENEYLEDDIWWTECSNCKQETHSRYGRPSTYRYCPNCGTRMDGDINE